MEKVKEECIGARVFIPSLHTDVTISKDSVAILKREGFNKYLESDDSPVVAHDTKVTFVKPEKKVDHQSMKLSELRTLYPHIKATSKTAFITKLETA